MSLQFSLLVRFLRESPFQPATDLWRSIEIAYVANRGLPVGRGLDVGCGDGHLMAILLEAVGQAPELVGVDIDPQEVAAARQFGIYAAFHVTSADRVSEPDASFDWAFSNSVLEHVQPIEETLAEVARVLRPGAPFIITVPSSDFHACLRGPIVGSRARYLTEIDRRCAHLRYWSDEEWRSAFSRHGFEMETCEGYLSVAEVRRWEAISGLTAGILFRLSGRHPIQIQRGLGLRRGQRLPRILALAAARVLTTRRRGTGHGLQACRYVVARRLAG
jgi:ubiquinone/menaquinone biosynthesis C-methylase UbiE